MYDQGILPAPMQRYCTRMSKIHPMEHWIGKAPATVYYGIRADEQRQGYITNKKFDIIPSYPLVEGNQTIYDVYENLHALDLLPPSFFWKELYQQVITLTQRDLEKQLHPLTFRQLFAWRSRTNCYFCFFQRRYEWIGLLDHYPDLYNRASELEESIGSKGYTWIQGVSLKEYAKRRETVIAKRAKQIAKFLTDNETLLDSEDPIDLLQVVSCGLFCGK